MMIYRLFEDPVFPDPEDAEPDGLLAVGGDLSVTRLLTAYANGIFPWYSPDSPILWWSTNPRLVLFPEELHVPKSLKRVLNQRRFEFTMDKDFRGVIRGCARTPRPGQDGTWIVDEMVEAYTLLHDMGFAHSVEAWRDGQLVGGVYGVALGGVFFGESMFYTTADASKAAFVMLVRQLCKWGFRLVDCQQTTGHLLRFGAVELQRYDFISRVRRSVEEDRTREGLWRFDWQRKNS